MQQEIVDFFTKYPHQFSVFCGRLLEGKDCYWKGHVLSSNETAAIYQTMREIFPGRKDN